MQLCRQIASSNGLLDPPALIRRQHFATVNAVDKIDIYDVAIIGGGPAGSTAATLLAKAGRRVVVFEREKFPRFHIGESLLPFSVGTFDRLGVREKLDQTRSEEHTSELQSRFDLVCRLLLEKKKRWRSRSARIYYFWTSTLTVTRSSTPRRR